MTTEQTEQTEDISGALAQGFNSVRGIAPPTETPATKAEEVTESPVETVAEAPAPAVLAGLTEEQVKSLLAKVSSVDQLQGEIRRLHGKIGELNGKLTQHPAPAAKPADAPDTTESDLLEDPDFAEISKGVERRIAKAVAEVRQSIPAGVDVAAAIAQETARVRQELAEEALEERHEGWKDTVRSDDFALWMQTKAESVRNELASSNSPRVVSKALDEFKAWKESTVSKKQNNRDRLAAAVTPQGTTVRSGPSVLPDSAGLAAGFARVRPIGTR